MKKLVSLLVLCLVIFSSCSLLLEAYENGIRYETDADGNLVIKRTTLFENGNLETEEFFYDLEGKYLKRVIAYSEDGIKILESEYFDPNYELKTSLIKHMIMNDEEGMKWSETFYEYYETGIKKKVTMSFYDKEGNITSHTETEYDKDGYRISE